MGPQDPSAPDPAGKVTSWRFEGSSLVSLVQRTGGTASHRFGGEHRQDLRHGKNACPGKAQAAQGRRGDRKGFRTTGRSWSAESDIMERAPVPADITGMIR